MDKIQIQLTVNGQEKSASVYPMERLLDVLREEFRLTGSKEGCGEGECGACAVLMDGHLVNSCLIPAVQADSTSITSIEGVESTISNGKIIQQAFIEAGGSQCGICTPGMIMAVVDFLQRRNGDKKPTESEIRSSLSGNLCRCTGYTKIFAAVALAAERIGEQA